MSETDAVKIVYDASDNVKYVGKYNSTTRQDGKIVYRVQKLIYDASDNLTDLTLPVLTTEPSSNWDSLF